MSQFILMIRGGYEATADFTPEEAQQSIARYSAWAQQLSEEKRLVSAFKLKDDGGRVMQRDGAQIVIDGPMAETRETIGGYFVIEAADYAEATEIAKGCPIFDQDGSIEVREIHL